LLWRRFASHRFYLRRPVPRTEAGAAAAPSDVGAENGSGRRRLAALPPRRSPAPSSPTPGLLPSTPCVGSKHESPCSPMRLAPEPFATSCRDQPRLAAFMASRPAVPPGCRPSENTAPRLRHPVPARAAFRVPHRLDRPTSAAFVSEMPQFNKRMNPTDRHHCLLERGRVPPRTHCRRRPRRIIRKPLDGRSQPPR
jgi:hypothetical protein